MIVMLWLCPALFTTLMPLPEMVKVWGELGETLEMVNRSPV